MTWRIVEIASNSKLELRLNYLIVRNVDTIRKVFIPEIAVLIIEGTAVSLTAALLCELSRNKIKIIFCDEKRNPFGELLPYYGCHNCVEKVRTQIGWDESISDELWRRIVRLKIMNQKNVLLRSGHIDQATLLASYADQIMPGDVTNREGHAAKVYFNALFGNDFSRRDEGSINSALNYGYAIILSSVNREISINGYLTQIGIFHDNMFNPFNLGSDLMEPFRPLVDEMILLMNPVDFTTSEKHRVVNILNMKVLIEGKTNTLINAIRIFVRSFFDSMQHCNSEELVDFEAEVHEGDCFL